jgi:hypothetical protein
MNSSIIETYQQIGDVLAEALGLSEAKAKPIPDDATPAQRRRLGDDAFYAKQSGRTPSTASKTRTRVNKGIKNRIMRRGPHSRNYRGRGPIAGYEMTAFKKFLDQGVSAPEEKS